MKHSVKIFTLSLLIAVFSMALADANTHQRIPSPAMKAGDSHPALYHPSLRRGGVLFVEDGSSYYPPTNPDPVWDGVLTNILGTGNYGWYGPTIYPTDDGPSLDTMQQYDLVIWNNYDQWDNPTLTANDMTNIASYINGGGKVWLIGQDLLYSGVPLSFLTTNFHVSSAAEDYTESASLNLEGMNEIAGITLSVSSDLLNVFYPDQLTPDALAHHVIFDTGNNANPAVFSNDATTSFWTVDGRTPTPWANWEQMVHDMLAAFGVLGVSERSSQNPVQKLQLNIAPEPLINSTTISYTLPVDDNVKLQVFNSVGQHVITLVDYYNCAGSYKVTWNGKDAKGMNVSAGVYLVRLTCGQFSHTEDLVVIK